MKKEFDEKTHIYMINERNNELPNIEPCNIKISGLFNYIKNCLNRYNVNILIIKYYKDTCKQLKRDKAIRIRKSMKIKEEKCNRKWRMRNISSERFHDRLDKHRGNPNSPSVFLAESLDSKIATHATKIKDYIFLHELERPCFGGVRPTLSFFEWYFYKYI
jgi:hypothetical protein